MGLYGGCFFSLLQVVYWDAYDGSAIRELEGLLTGSINAMDISQGGTHFVTGTGSTPFCYHHYVFGFFFNFHSSFHWFICIYLHLTGFFCPICVFFLFVCTPGGDDKLVKVWDYMEGAVTHVGMAHGGSITGIKLCSNSSTLISTSTDGAVVLWRFPHSPASWLRFHLPSTIRHVLKWASHVEVSI